MIALTLIALFTIAAAAAARPGSPPQPRRIDYGMVAPDRCLDAQRAIGFYRRAYTWQRARALLPGAPARVWYDCDATRRRAVEWRTKFRAAREHANKWLYDWESWLPHNWRSLGACETGYGRQPGNWEHANSSFVSAFGISRREYDADAAHMGAKPWNDRNPPPPRHQYLAGLGHLDRFGDGWSCPGP